jgi:hypothetical protein
MRAASAPGTDGTHREPFPAKSARGRTFDGPALAMRQIVDDLAHCLHGSGRRAADAPHTR